MKTEAFLCTADVVAKEKNDKYKEQLTAPSENQTASRQNTNKHNEVEHDKGIRLGARQGKETLIVQVQITGFIRTRPQLSGCKVRSTNDIPNKIGPYPAKTRHGYYTPL